MRDVVSSLLGVPAVTLIAAGLGIVAVTLVSRLRARPDRRPIRWAHLVLGVGLTGAGLLLLQAGIAVGGA
jgi:hypothetical protein